MLLQIILTLGIVVAQAINLGTQHIAGYGWRISLACAGIPAIVLTAGGLLLPDTPNSLIDRGREEEGKQVNFSSPNQIQPSGAYSGAARDWLYRHSSNHPDCLRAAAGRHTQQLNRPGMIVTASRCVS